MNHQAHEQIKSIAKETGMLVMKGGREYATCVTVGNKELSFEYENQDEEAYVTIYQKGKREITYGTNDFDSLRIEHPEFF